MIAQLSAWDYQWRLFIILAPAFFSFGACIGMCIDDAREINVDVPDIQRLWEPDIEARRVHLWWRQDGDTWVEDPS
jgi:hypothetical protein